MVPEQPARRRSTTGTSASPPSATGPNTAVELIGDGGEPSSSTPSSTCPSTSGPRCCRGSRRTTPTCTAASSPPTAAAGRAIAQAYGHAILPLCNERDLRTQVRWGIAGLRPPVRSPPRRACGCPRRRSATPCCGAGRGGDRGSRSSPPARSRRCDRSSADDSAWAVRRRRGRGRRPGAPRHSRPYRWQHPERPDLTVDLVVYDGALAHALAFAGPPARTSSTPSASRDGGGSWRRPPTARRSATTTTAPSATSPRRSPGAPPARASRTPRLVDVLDDRPADPRGPRARRAPGRAPTASAAGWPTAAATPAAPEGWNQAWRAPLRHALDVLRDWGVEVVDRRGAELLRDPWAARDDYLGLLIGARTWDDFAAEHVVGDGHRRRAAARRPAQRAAHVHVVRLVLQRPGRHRDRADPALRGPGHRPLPAARRGSRRSTTFLDVLAEARSNDPEAGDGRQTLARRRSCPTGADAPEVCGPSVPEHRGCPEAWRAPRSTPIACAIVSTQMQTCYRHADRRAGVHLPALRPADLPGLHAPGVGGLPLPRVHQAGRPEDRPRPASCCRPLVTQILDRDQPGIFVAGIGAGLRDPGPGHLRRRPRRLGLNPFSQELIGVANGEWYRLVTSGFLHANLIHVGFNMFVLYRLGQLLEPALGGSGSCSCTSCRCSAAASA